MLNKLIIINKLLTITGEFLHIFGFLLNTQDVSKNTVECFACDTL